MTSLRRNPRNYESFVGESCVTPMRRQSSDDSIETFTTQTNNTDSSMLGKITKQIIPVVFAIFINLLDAVTFGTCFFPTIFGKTSSLAIDLFLLSTVAVQVVFIFMSSFQCGLGTSMAENIPFIHTMALGVYDAMEGAFTVDEMLPTVLATVCVSTLLNGLAFFLVGYLRQGYILHYFPRHVILGMTLGFGVFLLSTAFQVTTGITPDDNIIHNLTSMRTDDIVQLVLVCTMEVVLRLTSFCNLGETAGPVIMLIIPLSFYMVLWSANISFDQARQSNWLFPIAESSNGWDMWKYFDIQAIHWDIVLAQSPTVLSLAAFTLLLVPIRIPTLAMITGDEVDFDLELKAQGIGNILSAAMGSVHNYISYSNSVFFFNIGGGGKGSQTVVAGVTFLLFIVGPQIINFVPRIIAGVIMLHLGFDLLNDSVIASKRALDSLEYTSTIIVGSVVTVFGFVPGIIAGGVSACVTFVVQSSKSSNVRGVFTGEVVRSNTAWPGRHRDKLEQALAAHGVYVIQLQGHIFFGNIQQVTKSIERIIENAYHRDSEGSAPALGTNSGYGSPSLSRQWSDVRSEGSDISGYHAVGTLAPSEDSPLPEYIVLDCSFVSGLDSNAIDGFLKLQHRMQSPQNQPRPIYITFAGLQQKLQKMFSNHLEENSKRFEGTESGVEVTHLSVANERTRLLSSDDDNLNFSIGSATGSSTGAFGGYEELSSRRRTTSNDWSQSKPGMSSSARKKKKKKRRQELARSESSPLDSKFHLDVNTALQSVEEHIIENHSSPRDIPSQEKMLKRHAARYYASMKPSSEEYSGPLYDFPMLQPNDSFHRIYSSDEVDNTRPRRRSSASTSSSPRKSIDYGWRGIPVEQIDEAQRSVPELSMKKKRLSCADSEEAGYIMGSYGSGAMTVVSPLKDISRKSILAHSPTECSSITSLPMTIGITSGASGMTLPSQQQRSSQTSISSTDLPPPKSLLIDIAQDQEDDHTDDYSLSGVDDRVGNEHSVDKVDKGRESPNKTEDNKLSISIPQIDSCEVSSRKRGRGDELKKLIRRMVFELDTEWRSQDFPVLKRLADYLRQNIKIVDTNESLWCAREKAEQMGLLITGRLEAVIETWNHQDHRTLQIILPGTLIGELGLLSGGSHSRTIIATKTSEVAILTKETLEEIEREDTVLLCALQKLALKTAAGRSHQLMLFSAGALGPK